MITTRSRLFLLRYSRGWYSIGEPAMVQRCWEEEEESRTTRTARTDVALMMVVRSFVLPPSYRG